MNLPAVFGTINTRTISIIVYNVYLLQDKWLATVDKVLLSLTNGWLSLSMRYRGKLRMRVGDLCWHKCDSRICELNMAAGIEIIGSTLKKNNG